jgi:hypothetical protein
MDIQNDLISRFSSYIKKNSKRIILFLFGCMILRISMGLFMKSDFCQGWICDLLGVLILIMGIGFLVIYFGGLRKSGLETDGQPIWWNHLRPLHGVLYLLSGWLLLNGNGVNAGNIIIVDALIGLIAWKIYHIGRMYNN